MTMYEDGRKTGGFEEAIEIVDVAELLVEAIEAGGRVAVGTDADTDEAAAAADD
jgi:hypothetical protein